MYMAASALRISSSASVGAPGSATEIPRLARMIRELCPRSTGRLSAARMRSAVSAAAWRSLTSSSSTANSSPPKRAAVSPARTLPDSRWATSSRTASPAADPLVEQCAGGEVGDRVMEGRVGELLLEGLALADVAAVEDDPLDGGVLQQIGVQHLEVAQGAVLVGEQALHGIGLAAAGAVGEPAQHPTLLVGVQQVIEGTAHD